MNLVLVRCFRGFFLDLIHILGYFKHFKPLLLLQKNQQNFQFSKLKAETLNYSILKVFDEISTKDIYMSKVLKVFLTDRLALSV